MNKLISPTDTGLPETREPTVLTDKVAPVYYHVFPTAGLVLGGLAASPIGVGLLLAAFGVIPMEGDPAKGAFPWFLFVPGMLFTSIGGLTGFYGFAEVIRRCRVGRALGRHPGESWRADFQWRPEGMRGRESSLSRFMIFISLLMCGFFIPLAISSYADRDDSWLMRIGLSVFALMMIGMLAISIGQTAVGRKRFDAPMLRFTRFPFFLGETLDAELVNLSEPERFGALEFSLLCIRDIHEKRETNIGRQPVALLVYATVDVRYPSTDRGASGGIPVSFRLPTDCEATSLMTIPPVFWEIEVHSHGGLDDYHESFLVPVYAKPAPKP